MSPLSILDKNIVRHNHNTIIQPKKIYVKSVIHAIRT